VEEHVIVCLLRLDEPVTASVVEEINGTSRHCMLNKHSLDIKTR
jgi:hypothetical protein